MSTTKPIKTNTEPLYSTFASDPEMAELIEFFSGELGQRIASIEQALDSNDLDTLHRLAHQLKGSAGGYGYPTIGEAAAKLEAEAKQALADQAADLQHAASELLALCHRACAS
ncbi:MAG: Hpt domain-containing protein [Phycisphaerales bacterium JB063]